MSIYRITGAPFIPSTSYQNNAESQGAQSSSAEPVQQSTETSMAVQSFGNQKMPPELWQHAFKYLSTAKIAQARVISQEMRAQAEGFLINKYAKPGPFENFSTLNDFLKRCTNGNYNLWLSAFYRGVLSRTISGNFNILETGNLLHKMLSPELPSVENFTPDLFSLEQIGLLHSANLQELDGASPEHINYLTSMPALWSLIDLHSQGLKFDSSAFLQITPLGLKDRMKNMILRLADSDVEDPNIREKICQFLSSLCPKPKENEYSNIETLNKKLEALNALLQEQSREVIRDLALMTQCGIFVNEIDGRIRGAVKTLLYYQLQTAVASGDLKGKYYVAILLAAGAKPNQQNLDGQIALHWVARLNDGELVQAIINASADINAKDIYGLATVLHYAAENNNLQAISALVNAGADINAKDNNGLTALHYVAKYNDLQAIPALVNAGADINAKDNYGLTALHWAVQNNNLQAIPALVNAGANINAKDNNELTALHYAAKNNNLQAIPALVNAGADINAKSNARRTALHWAVRSEHGEFAEALIDAGANIDEKDEDGETAESYVMKVGTKQMLNFVLRATATSMRG